MNIPRLFLAVVAVFVVMFASDALIHGMWLKPDYDAAKAIFRPEAEMGSYLPYLIFAQIVCATTFVVVWAMGFAGRGVGMGILFALLMGLFQQTWVLVNYAIFPISGDLALKWYFSGLVQAVLIGITVALVYRPRAAIS
jgi:hypothetical protein